MINKELEKKLTGVSDLDHQLPDGDWETYLVSIFKIAVDGSLSPVKKTVRIQKIMRYIHDNEAVKQ